MTWQFFVPFLGWLSDPLKGLNDLQLGDEKGTLNHLVICFSAWASRSFGMAPFFFGMKEIPVSQRPLEW